MTKDDFIFNLKRCGCLYKDGNTYYEENELIKCFEDVGTFNQPPVNPQERTGHWIDSSNGWMCSKCNKDNTLDTNYCPNCGYRMIPPQEIEEQEEVDDWRDRLDEIEREEYYESKYRKGDTDA